MLLKILNLLSPIIAGFIGYLIGSYSKKQASQEPITPLNNDIDQPTIN